MESYSFPKAYTEPTADTKKRKTTTTIPSPLPEGERPTREGMAIGELERLFLPSIVTLNREGQQPRSGGGNRDRSQSRADALLPLAHGCYSWLSQWQVQGSRTNCAKLSNSGNNDHTHLAHRGTVAVEGKPNRRCRGNQSSSSSSSRSASRLLHSAQRLIPYPCLLSVTGSCQASSSH